MPGALVETGVRLAYRGQHTAMLVACAALQKIARRVALGGQPAVDRGQLRALQRRFRALLARDLANVEAGLYPRELLFDMPLGAYARALPSLARDVPRMVARMRRGDWRDLPDLRAEVRRRARPDPTSTLARTRRCTFAICQTIRRER